MKRTLPLILALPLLLSCCTGRKADITPRRYAFPRIESYGTYYRRAQLGGVSFEINSAADTAMPRPQWLDIAYPRYGVTVHMAANTFSSQKELDEAVANRYRRMQLNFGDARVRTEQFENTGGFSCTLAGSSDAGTAPVFFIATDSAMHLVSGAAVFAGSTQPFDSISPIYNDIYRDITNLLLSLR